MLALLIVSGIWMDVLLMHFKLSKHNWEHPRADHSLCYYIHLNCHFLGIIWGCSDSSRIVWKHSDNLMNGNWTLIVRTHVSMRQILDGIKCITRYLASYIRNFYVSGTLKSAKFVSYWSSPDWLFSCRGWWLNLKQKWGSLCMRIGNWE